MSVSVTHFFHISLLATSLGNKSLSSLPRPIVSQCSHPHDGLMQHREQQTKDSSVKPLASSSKGSLRPLLGTVDVKLLVLRTTLQIKTARIHKDAWEMCQPCLICALPSLLGMFSPQMKTVNGSKEAVMISDERLRGTWLVVDRLEFTTQLKRQLHDLR